jgi:transposase
LAGPDRQPIVSRGSGTVSRAGGGTGHGSYACRARIARQYGPRRESIDPDQLRLFTDEEPEDLAEDAPEEPSQPEDATPARRRWRRRGRQRLPEHLPREWIEYKLPAEELPCPDCGHLRAKIGEEVSEQLEYVPASMRVLQHVWFRYACRACQEHVAIADKPPQPIDKGLPGPGLLAQTITSKYSDHLPLYRLEDIFARHGMELSRATLRGWMASCAELTKSRKVQYLD